MPLFGSNCDSQFILGINRELIKNYIDTEVAIYKLSLEDTDKNIYNESPRKIYYQPVRIHSIIREDPDSHGTNDGGYDIGRTVRFGFIKDDLQSKSLYLEAGDIIGWDNNYYEVDIVENQQRWGNRNPDTHIGSIEYSHPAYGYQIGVMVNAHLTRQTRIQINENIRPDIDSISLRKDPQRRSSIYGE